MRRLRRDHAGRIAQGEVAGSGAEPVFWNGYSSASRRMLEAFSDEMEPHARPIERPVVTYRCERCGLLKAYARPGSAE